MTQQPLKLLIVDDSRIFRSLVELAVRDMEEVQVVGSVWNGIKAMEAIHQSPPDLVTLDVEMPQMGGMETLRAIQSYNAQHPERAPVGVLMLSAHTREGVALTLSALEAGAFDFITKPQLESDTENFARLQQDLLRKILVFRRRRMAGSASPARPFNKPRTATEPPRAPSPSDSRSIVVPASAPAHSAAQSPASGTNHSPSDMTREAGGPVRAVLIAVSTGGPQALSTLLPELTRHVEVPIFIVQHMPPEFTRLLADSFAKRCESAVIEAGPDDIVHPKTVYIAPGGRHLMLRSLEGSVRTGLTDQPPENGCRPSADVLFRSAAHLYGGGLVAVVLTGMGSDGSRGLGPLKRAGAHVIAQDQATSVVWGMPGSAVETGMVDEVLALGAIAPAVARVIRNRSRGGSGR